MELVRASGSKKRYSTSVQNCFAGYNHNLSIDSAQFYDMRNLTSDYYPVFSTRDKRGILSQMKRPWGLFGGESLAWVDVCEFYYDGNYVCDVLEGEKQFCRIGALLCIFPDKIIYNTVTGTVENMENEVRTQSNVSYCLCDVNGQAYAPYVGDREPDKQTSRVWLDTSSTPNVLKEYIESQSQWVSIASTYIRISCQDIGTAFAEYDAVTITGSDVADLNTDNIVYGAGEGYLIVAGLLDEPVTQSTVVTLKRSVPDMDFVTQMDNRIWGCSSKNNEIYACKLGDPKNWRCYMGISSDSYAATVGAEGDFTGATTHMGCVLFFKENAIIRVYGTDPSSYAVTSTQCRGVQEGSEKSLITINGILYYKSANGICSYDGSLPASISSDLGNELYFEACAGFCKEKYYVCMRNSSYDWKVYVYDTVRGMWHCEDEQQIQYFANVSGGLYCIDEEKRLVIMNMDALVNTIFPGMTDTQYEYPGDFYPNQNFEYETEDDFAWSAETGDIGIGLAKTKYLSELLLRMVLGEDAQLKISIQYNSDGKWHRVVELKGNDTKKSYQLPIQIMRCDHARMKLEGTGECRIYSISMKTEGGSEVND